MSSTKLARLNYAVRAGAFAWCFTTIGIHLWERGYGWPAWVLLAAQFLVYPHLMYWRAVRSPRPNRGGIGMLWAALSSLAGAILWALIGGFRFEPQTSDLVTTLCVLGAVIYVSVVGYVVYRQTRNLSAARDALGKSEERYRLIAENAADLIAMVDHEGRWLYTSPSYGRMLAPVDLAPGVD